MLHKERLLMNIDDVDLVVMVANRRSIFRIARECREWVETRRNII